MTTLLLLINLLFSGFEGNAATSPEPGTTQSTTGQNCDIIIFTETGM